MKLKRTLSYSDKKQIWRLLVSNTDKLIIETRDVKEKEVFFHSFFFDNGKEIFKNLQLDEKYWLGIESVKNDIIYFHKFAKPNMPEHKKIIAYDIFKNEVIWQNDDLTYLTFLDNKIYAFKKKFEGKNVYVLNHLTGEIIEELGDDFQKLNEIINLSQSEEDFSDYKYPEQIVDLNNFKHANLIEKETKFKNIHSNINYLEFEELLFFNYYLINKKNKLSNFFVAYNLSKNKRLLSETLDENLNSFSPDSFFCFKNYLIMIKNKNTVIVYKIV
ncbi:MAG: hypothetical protein CR986_09060 [Ignavibacteriae bacterium]|nr:MAG: hypothetical protein CR986_09060 [Ignavibacteriota bacterium]